MFNLLEGVRRAKHPALFGEKVAALRGVTFSLLLGLLAGVEPRYGLGGVVMKLTGVVGVGVEGERHPGVAPGARTSCRD